MENKRNSLPLVHLIIWAIFYVIICEAEENSGDLQIPVDIQAELVNVSTLPIVTENNTNRNFDEETTMQETSMLITKLTLKVTTTTDQSQEVTSDDTTISEKLETTTKQSTDKTTTKQSTDKTTTKKTKTTRSPTKEKQRDERELLNGYKIATFCLAAILGILFLIILIYIITKSRTGHGDITSPPSTPPQTVGPLPMNEEPKIVRLSSYFPYAEKDEVIGDSDADDRNVSSFLTRKKSVDTAAGSQDTILHTSEL